MGVSWMRMHAHAHAHTHTSQVRLKEGGLNMPPPVVSRIYQELSNGALGFHQAQKISRVPFPFPYAQLLAIMKVYFILTVPMAVVCFTDSVPFAIFMSFFTSFIFVCLNEVRERPA